MSNRIKFYNSAEHSKKIDILINQKDAAKKLSEAKIAFAGYETLEEIEDYLNSKTGFVNTRLSAEALSLEDQYNDTLLISQTQKIKKLIKLKKY